MEASRQPETPAAVALTRMLSPMGDASYNHWITRNEPQGPEGREELKKRYKALKDRPLFSIIVPTYNSSASALAEMMASVREQVYENWELCIADDASTHPHVRSIIDEAAVEDPRIKVIHRSTNGHICKASNSALELATGSWIAMLDHDDTLAPQALLAVAEYLAEHPSTGLVYSDEDKLDERGQRFDPYFKPDYSPELLLAQNYMNHLTVVRSDLVRDVGGWRIGFEGSQDHDLILRVIEKLKPAQVGHIPQILYHWRALTGSTALGNEEKTYVLRTGEAAVRDHLIRTGQRGKVEVLKGVHHYRVRYQLPKEKPLVSLIIPTRDKADVLKIAVDSILKKSTYDNYEILIVDNGSMEEKTIEYFASLRSDDKVKILSYPHPFNYSKINNFAVKHAGGSVIALVNNDIEVITPDWIEEMTSWVLKKEIGCVGAKLYYPDMSIQHAGVIIGLGGCAGHSHKYFPHDAAGYFNRLQVHQNLSAVTAACLFVRRDVFEQVGGLEERLTVAFNDVDFCLRVRDAGYRNLFTPFAKLFHHESISRGAEDTPEKMARAAAEVRFMQDRWKEKLTIDPYYSPHLPYDREDFGINMAGLRY
jgi:glycosyltransferase involved in cell wall biosynthesis